MDLRLKALGFSLVLVLLFSMGSASHVSAEKQILKTKCQQANLTALDAPQRVTLNGENVEEIKCSNFEAYSFPGNSHVQNDEWGFGTGPSTQDFMLFVVLPPVLMFGAAGILSWRTELGRKRSLVLFFGAVVSFIGESALLLLMAGLNLDYSVLLLVIPVLLGLFTLPAYLLYSKDMKSRKTRSKAAVSFLFIAAINWAIIVYPLFAQGAFNTVIA